MCRWVITEQQTTMNKLNIIRDMNTLHNLLDNYDFSGLTTNNPTTDAIRDELRHIQRDLGLEDTSTTTAPYIEQKRTKRSMAEEIKTITLRLHNAILSADTTTLLRLAYYLAGEYNNINHNKNITMKAA